MLGRMHEHCSKLNVMVACCARCDQSWKGKFVSVLHNPLIKWFLKV